VRCGQFGVDAVNVGPKQHGQQLQWYAHITLGEDSPVCTLVLSGAATAVIEGREACVMDALRYLFGAWYATTKRGLGDLVCGRGSVDCLWLYLIQRDMPTTDGGAMYCLMDLLALAVRDYLRTVMMNGGRREADTDATIDSTLQAMSEYYGRRSEDASTSAHGLTVYSTVVPRPPLHHVSVHEDDVSATGDILVADCAEWDSMTARCDALRRSLDVAMSLAMTSVVAFDTTRGVALRD